ncbi:MAG: WD40 repeat domain-containing serine/threonine protein kinase, partial [Vulcanimicrobiota bacterium]
MSNDETIFQSDQQQTQAQQASLQGVPSLEGYQLSQKLGSGAFGEVWGGIQNSTGQRVAVKFFLERNASELENIQRELERLREVCDHPAVVGLIDADLEHRPPYLVMPWLARSLEHWPGRPGPGQASDWLKQVAQGLQHTHDKGLLHCDLKPSNIMLDEGNLARLADFGQSRQQGDGVIAWGTLGYMAPEQALLGSEAAGSSPSVRWDVYGLGATFYRLLTGNYPYLSEGQLRELQQMPLERRLPEYRRLLLNSPLIPPHRLNRSLDQDLSDILQACLQTDPERRLSGMALLLQDLRRRRRGEPLLCRQPWTLLYRLSKWVRQPALVVSAGLAVALLAGGISAYRQQRGALDRQTRLMAAMLSERGAERLRQGYADEGWLWLAGALEKAPQQPNLRRALARSQTPLIDYRPDAGVFAYHPRGQEMVWCDRGGSFFLGSGQKLALPLYWTGQDAAYSTSGRYLALLCQDGLSQPGIWLYDTQTRRMGESPLRPGGKGSQVSLAFDEQDRLLSLHPDGARLCLWSPEGKLLSQQFLGPDGLWKTQADPAVTGALGNFSPDGRWLMARLDDKTTCLVELGGPRKRCLPGLTDIRLQPFSADSRWCLLRDGPQPELLNLQSQTLSHPSGGSFACFAGVDQVALIDGKNLRLRSLKDASQELTLRHASLVSRAQVSPDGKMLLSQTEGGLLWLWDLNQGCLVSTKPSSAFSLFGFVGASSGFYSTHNGLHHWAIRPQTALWNLNLKPEKVLGLRVAPDWLMAVQKGQLTFLNSQGKRLSQFESADPASQAIVSERGLVALETRQSYSLLWNLPGPARQQQLVRLPRTAEQVFSSRMAFDGLGNLLAVITNQQVELWDTRREPATRLGQVSCPNPQAVAISSDGRWMAALCGLDMFDTADWRLWSVPELSPATVPSLASELRSPGSNTRQLEFGPGGKWLWMRNGDAYAVLTLPKGEIVTHFSEKSWITQVAMSPDGQVLFLPQSEGLGQFRSLPGGKLLGQPLQPGNEHQYAFGAAFTDRSDLCALASRDGLMLYDPARAFALGNLAGRD